MESAKQQAGRDCWTEVCFIHNYAWSTARASENLSWESGGDTGRTLYTAAVVDIKEVCEKFSSIYSVRNEHTVAGGLGQELIVPVAMVGPD